MSVHQAFRRQPVPGQYAQSLKHMTFPAPTRGIVLDENEAFMRPGACIISDNWMPTLRGLKLRGGCIRHCDLHALDAVVPPVPSALRKPVISSFTYQNASNLRMFAAQLDKLFDVTSTTPVLVKDTQTSGNYAAAQMSNAAGNWMIVVNDSGADFPLRFDGTTWTTLSGAEITGPPGGAKTLVFVWKYRNRLFFIESGSMNAWYLGIDSVSGAALKIPLSGAASKGGKLLCGFSWSLDAGDGISEKCCFMTDLGEILIFVGTDPGNAANWRQEGRYAISPPLGMNGHQQVGGDMLILTVDGIVPLSQAIVKNAGQLDLAMITRPIRQMWREEAVAKRAWAWTMSKWDEYGGLFITTPGGVPGQRWCLGMNNVTNAWCRLPGYDATCFIRLRGDMFFGTQDGIVMQADRTGYDDGNHRKVPYVATLVGGWDTFKSGAAQTVWHQARATFTSSASEPFLPQLAATVDYVITVPPPPPPGPDPGIADVWDEGLWDDAVWDAPSLGRPAMRNTLWMSIGMMGFAHAPIVQVTVAQVARPSVELVAIAATYEGAGVNV